MSYYIKACLVFLCCYLAACMQNQWSIVIEYDDVKGLTQQAPVYFNNEPIGKVTKVVYTDAGAFDVFITLEKKYRHLARQNTQFVLTATSSGTTNGIEVVEANTSSEQLVSGDRIKGTTKYKAFANNLKNTINDTLRSVKSTLHDTIDEITNENIEIQIESLGENIDRWLLEVDSMSENTKTMLKKDFLPKIREKCTNMQDYATELKNNEALLTMLDRIEEKLEALRQQLDE